MRFKLSATVSLLFAVISLTLIHLEEKQSVLKGLPSIAFQLDDQSTIEYWHWQRSETLPTHPVTWVMPGIGGPGEILDAEFAAELIDIMSVGHVDQVFVVQLRGHSLDSELACPFELDFDPCITKHREAGLDLTRYHYQQYAQDVIQLRRHLGVDRWFVWGASYGGRVAGAMALLDPTGTRGLLLDSSIALNPADRPSDYKISSELLHKLLAACSTLGHCFDQHNGSLDELSAFVEQFEDPYQRIQGFDYISINKIDFIDQLNELMYGDLELAIEWIFLHIRNKNGFSNKQMSPELREIVSNFGYIIAEDNEDYWSINYWVTHCNEDPSIHTFQTIDYGVYGTELDAADLCWTLRDWPDLPVTAPDIPVVIAHLPFDNVITYQDGESFLNYWPNAHWCTVELTGHTLPGDYASRMIQAMSAEALIFPDFCQAHLPRLYTAKY